MNAPAIRIPHAAATLAPTKGQPEANGLAAGEVRAAVERAAARIPPLWPLASFVAVNPFLGLADTRFEDAARLLAWVGDARLTMPRDFYAAAIASGRISQADLAAALRNAEGGPARPSDLAALEAVAGAAPAPAGGTIATVARTADEVTGSDWSALVAERISAWAAAHFDQGQAAWRMPWGTLSPFRSWRRYASADRTPEIAGLTGFRRSAAGLPDDAEEAIRAAVSVLGVPGDALEPYLHALLLSIGGWAGHARHHDWQAGLDGREGKRLVDMLAVRLGWEAGLLQSLAGSRPAVAAAWKEACRHMPVEPPAVAGLEADLALQDAYELGWQRQFLGRLPATPQGPARSVAKARPLAQAVFCIDVRSEVFRRALEGVDDGIETLGFAGFFGFPIEVVKPDHDSRAACCPVLLKPSAAVELDDAEAAAPARGAIRRSAALARALRHFRSGPLGPFGFVETLGLSYLGRLAADGLGWSAAGSRTGGVAPVGGAWRPRLHGVGDEERIRLAAGALRGMSLTQGFARLVVLIGHGSTSANNPYASGLDCGACGGHSGETNAQIAAATLNERAVRRGLAENGILVPDDTVFLAALHDTTTDRVVLFDQDGVPAGHAEDLQRLADRLAAAGALARAERAGGLAVPADARLEARMVARAHDWSQVRPEWGLAGCAAFVAAPRSRTAAVDLGGRVFLHSYDWRRDAGFTVLELILTAPLVVASWINLQYYGSTVDNERFGSGNKTLHNVVGLLGVLEGNGGDLRTGLPLQSLHDGARLVHEPLRLTAVVEAPAEAIDAVLARHAHVRDLVENGWIHLFAMTDAGMLKRNRGEPAWRAVPAIHPDTGEEFPGRDA